MFTGIVESVGRVERVTKRGGGRRFRISAPFAAELRVDESVSVDGCCQTVVAADLTGFDVDSIEETLAKTTFGSFPEGRLVNLERALKLGDRLDGHLVQGHIDTTGQIVSREELETSWVFQIAFPRRFDPYIIPVGSIAVDGISLTVARLGEDSLNVAIIPHTFEHTTVRTWEVGRTVNLEFDMIGKYVARQSRPDGAAAMQGRRIP
jgi:riboflavin synthase